MNIIKTIFELYLNFICLFGKENENTGAVKINICGALFGTCLFVLLIGFIYFASMNIGVVIYLIIHATEHLGWLTESQLHNIPLLGWLMSWGDFSIKSGYSASNIFSPNGVPFAALTFLSIAVVYLTDRLARYSIKRAAPYCEKFSFEIQKS